MASTPDETLGIPVERPERPDLSPKLDPTPLVVARFPLGWTPSRWPEGFVVLVRDDDEVTLVCVESEYADDGSDRPGEQGHADQRHCQRQRDRHDLHTVLHSATCSMQRRAGNEALHSPGRQRGPL